MKTQFVFERYEIPIQIPYMLVCETFSSSFSKSGLFKRKLKEVFSEEDRKIINKLVRISRTWSLTKGVPDVYVCSTHDFNLWKRLEVFCVTITGGSRMRNSRRYSDNVDKDKIICGSVNIHCYNASCDHNTPENTCMYGVTMDLIRHAQSDKPMCEKLRKEVLRRFCGGNHNV